MMFFIFFVALLQAFAAVSAKDELPSIYGMQRLAIYGNSDTKLKLLRTLENHPSFDFIHVPAADEDPVDVLVEAKVAKHFKKSLQSHKVHFKVVNEDVSELIKPESVSLRAKFDWLGAAESFPRDFLRYKEIRSYVEGLGRDHSDIVKTFSLGKSTEGRDLVVLKISSGGDGEKPALFIDAGIHAREWMAPATALYAIKQLVENSTNHYIFKDIDIYIVPLVNPDGYEYTHQSIETRLWRKTRSRQTWGCRGVDANRNFGFKWLTTGASPYPCSETYAGNRPFSEPESRALRDFLMKHKDQIKVYLSLHSFGQYILYPWGYKEEAPKNEATLRCVAGKAERELSKVRGTHYKIGSSSTTLYPAAGGSDDWAMGAAGIDLAYTIELPGGPRQGIYGFAPPKSEIEPVGRETFEAFKVFAQYVEKKICTTRNGLYLL